MQKEKFIEQMHKAAGKDLDEQILVLKVAEAELKSLKPQRCVYTRKAGLFYLNDKEVVLKGVADKLKKAEQDKQNLATE